MGVTSSSPFWVAKVSVARDEDAAGGVGVAPHGTGAAAGRARAGRDAGGGAGGGAGRGGGRRCAWIEACARRAPGSSADQCVGFLLTGATFGAVCVGAGAGVAAFGAGCAGSTTVRGSGRWGSA